MQKREHVVRSSLLVPVLALSCLTWTCPAPAADTRSAASVTGGVVGNIIDPMLPEASGLAPSRLRDDVLWVLNDSGNPAELFAVSTNGTVLAKHAVAGVKNRDWEDLVSFEFEGRPFLMIGEIGDNDARHRTCTLYLVEEPAQAENVTAPLKVDRKIRFRYEDGPRDVESLAVDPTGERALLLSKRDTPPVLYELSLREVEEDELLTARRVCELTTLPQPTPTDLKVRFGEVFSQPTSMDLSPDGRWLVILTYKNAYVYGREHDQAWSEALKKPPHTILLPYPATGIMRKREAICFSRDATAGFVTAEGQPAPLFRFDGED